MTASPQQQTNRIQSLRGHLAPSPTGEAEVFVCPNCGVDGLKLNRFGHLSSQGCCCTNEEVFGALQSRHRISQRGLQSESQSKPKLHLVHASSAIDWLELLKDVHSDWALLPLDGSKRPIDPSTGQLQKAWTSEAFEFDIDFFDKAPTHVRAVGVKLGPASGGLLAVDFDGPGSSEKFKEVFGRDPSELPGTVAVTSGKPQRQQRFFLVHSDWWKHLRGRRHWKNDQGKCVLELRWSGSQSAIAGDHPETDGYRWVEGASPTDHPDPALAPEWLLKPLTKSQQQRKEPKSCISTAEDSPCARAMLQCLPPKHFQAYDSWLHVGMALHSEDQGLLTDWVEWSRQMDNFDEQECLKKWESFTASPDGINIGSLHHWAKQYGYREPARSKHITLDDRLAKDQHEQDLGPSAVVLSPLDEWEHNLRGWVDPSSSTFERNTVRRQIKAQTDAQELGLRLSFPQVRARLLALQRELITGATEKGTQGGQIARFKPKEFLINGLITKRCLTAVAAFAKVGKTKLLSELAASLVFQRPFMGNPDWAPAPGPHKLILWWTDQPGADSEGYLKAVGLMDSDGRLHHQVITLFTEDDDLCWDDQGIDTLLDLLKDNPDAVLLTDSFFANIQRLHGTDNEPEAGGTLIDVQTLLAHYGTTHICAFHSPKEIGPVGINAIRGHSSAAGAVSAAISLHFLEKRDPQGNGKWVPDKDNPHRRLVFEGRGPYQDLLIRGNWQQGTFSVLGDFTKELAALTADDRRVEALDDLTEGQRQTLEWVGTAIGMWKVKDGVTASQVAGAIYQPRKPNPSELEITRKQLNALTKKQLLSATKKAGGTRYRYRADLG